MNNCSRTLALLLMAVALPSAAAGPAPQYDVGVTGECRDSTPDGLVLEGAGGEDGLILSSDGNQILTVTGAVAAAIALIDNPVTAAQGQGCNSSGADHVEAHAEVEGVGAEVCYDSTVRADGACYLNA